MAEVETENKNDREPTLEMRFAAIDQILEKMEGSEISLDESFELYKEGLSQVRAANAALDRIEKAMLVLSQEGNLEEF